MTIQPKLVLAVLVVLLAALGGYGLRGHRADAEAMRLNAAASYQAMLAREATARADGALEMHAEAVHRVAELEQVAATAKARVRTVTVTREVPAECETIIREVIAQADTAFVADSSRIVALEADNTRLGSALEASRTRLAEVSRELDRQATRVATPRGKLLGILPTPSLVLGYGASLVDGKLRTGPQLTIGVRLSL